MPLPQITPTPSSAATGSGQSLLDPSPLDPLAAATAGLVYAVRVPSAAGWGFYGGKRVLGESRCGFDFFGDWAVGSMMGFSLCILLSMRKRPWRVRGVGEVAKGDLIASGGRGRGQSGVKSTILSLPP